jgi:hypothetical protein
VRLLRQRVTEPPTDETTPAGRLSVLGGAVGRFVGLLALATLLVLVISVPMGLLLGASMSRSISVGFYVIGSFLLIAGFFVGNRGPVRLKGDETDVAAGVGMFGIGLSGRRLRWATPEENADAMASSAVFVAIGFVLIVIGVIADSRVQLL